MCEVLDIFSYAMPPEQNARAGTRMVIGIFPMRRKNPGADNAYRTN